MRQFTTFDVAGHRYGVDFHHLREVLEQLPMTSVPLAPATIRGVVNLRGDLLPVLAIDEWLEPGTPPSAYFRRQWMAVFDVQRYYFGVLVDRVGTATLEGELEPAGLGRTQFLEGVAPTLNGLQVLRLPSLLRHLENGLRPAAA